ncbi:hypothetical protein TNCV_2907411 [Trichonephila clavipes]|nr:hypothetical protein TNCV_2907411 [Trichonephila clavipes]
MGNRLRKLKALLGEKVSDGKTIGGKGRLTDAIISKLTTFYGNAIRANSHNIIIIECDLEVLSGPIILAFNDKTQSKKEPQIAHTVRAAATPVLTLPIF